MDLNATQIGLVFLVSAAIYALTTPLAGWIGDKTVSIHITQHVCSRVHPLTNIIRASEITSVATSSSFYH